MPSVSLCMMVKKDDYRFLRSCLGNIAAGVDEILMVVDGRDDEINAIASEFGAKLIEHPYQDSSALQRNVVLRRARMDWILVVDADELLSAADIMKLKHTADSTDCVACVLNQLNYTNDTSQARFVPARNDITEQFGFSGYYTVPTIRFFRNNRGFFFTRRVHEMVDESIEERGLMNKVLRTDVPLHHLKMLKGNDQLKKDELRYLQLLELELQDNPRNAKAHFDIGTIQLFTLKNHQEAIESLKKALELNPDFTEAKLNLAFAYGEVKEYEKALALYKELEKKEQSYHVLSSIAACLFFLRRYEEAIDYYRRAAAAAPERRNEAENRIKIIEKIVEGSQ